MHQTGGRLSFCEIDVAFKCLRIQPHLGNGGSRGWLGLPRQPRRIQQRAHFHRAGCRDVQNGRQVFYMAERVEHPRWVTGPM